MSYRIERTTIDGQTVENVVRIADNAFIPPDPANIDYAAFQAWRVAGGVPDVVQKTVAQAPRADTQALLDRIAALEAFNAVLSQEAARKLKGA